MFVGVGALIIIGIIGFTVGSEYMSREAVSSNIKIVIPAETQKVVEKTLVGDKKKMSFFIDGQLVFAERR